MLRKALEVGAYLVTHVAERGHPLLLSPLDGGRIYEAMVQAVCGAEKDWTALLRIVTDGQEVTEGCPLNMEKRQRVWMAEIVSRGTTCG